MFRSFLSSLGSLLFALVFLLFLQLDWRGKTLETHLTAQIRSSSIVYFLQNRSDNIQKTTVNKINNLKKYLTKKTKKQLNGRLGKLSKSIKKTFKRKPSAAPKVFTD